ncbi:hypothetical protein [Neglectibacter timonensis]|uniref:hypothetical protein n=1 Tax=Neglectibacter timonensis TaxID=1776382 RepID=UPI002055F73E|nr:MAG TPA: hypothetical protein [Caudoviricetes sp.]
MELIYKTVRGSQQTRPEELDLTSSPDKVYLRRNITTVTEDNADTGESVQLWQYDEAILTREEYAQYKAETENAGQQQIMEKLQTTATDDSQLIIMEALADLYDLIASLA